MKQVCKALLSIWIIYHLIIALTMPNGTSFVGRKLHSFLFPYGTSLGLNTPWNFFSPDPAHIMYFKYSVYFKNENFEDIREPIEGFIPEEKEHGPYTMDRRRVAYAMRYMVLDPRRVDLFLGPWLCRQFPGASNIALEHIYDTIPPLERALFDIHTDIRLMGEKIELIDRDFNCLGENDEISS